MDSRDIEIENLKKRCARLHERIDELEFDLACARTDIERYNPVFTNPRATLAEQIDFLLQSEVVGLNADADLFPTRMIPLSNVRFFLKSLGLPATIGELYGKL